MDIVALSRELMYQQTLKNKAPSWLLTELVVKKGEELAKQYSVDQRLVITAIYLTHTVFSPKKDDIQKHHAQLSADFAKPYLQEWEVPLNEQAIIVNAIAAHDGTIPTESRIAEVVKNAECFKFVSVAGSMILFHEFGMRQVPFPEAVIRVLGKMEEKMSLVTLEDCKQEAQKNCRQIEPLFAELKALHIAEQKEQNL